MDTLFSYRYMRILVAILLVMIIAAVGAMAAQSLNILDGQYEYASINVEGVAEVNAIPDIGVFRFTVEAEESDVATAQQKSGESINAIMEYLKSEGGVEEKDIKTTGYNTYPRYEYNNTECVFGRCNNERELKGYVVTQNVEVKVRETDKAGTLIGGVGTRGATNISGLSFEVDDIESLKEEARLAAVADARGKAKRLAKELEVRLGDLQNFYDETGGGDYYPEPYMARSVDMAFAEGGMEKSFAPEIAVGEDTITARVNITYKVK